MTITSRGQPFKTVWIGTATTGAYYTLQDSMTVSTMTVGANNTLELAGLAVSVSSMTNSGALILRGTETITTAPRNAVGSTVTYNATSGSPLVFSTWTYQILQVNGNGGSLPARGQINAPPTT